MAVGHRALEEHLKKTLGNEVRFVGETVYREGLLRAIGQNGPSLVVLRDALKGSEDLLSLIYSVKTTFPDVRIVFIGVERDDRDMFYANLVNYGIYDLIVGGRINVNEIVERIRIPGKHSDVAHFQPAPGSLPTTSPTISPVQAITSTQPSHQPSPPQKEKEIAPVAIVDDDDEDDDDILIGKKEDAPASKKEASPPETPKGKGFSLISPPKLPPNPLKKKEKEVEVPSVNTVLINEEEVEEEVDEVIEKTSPLDRIRRKSKENDVSSIVGINAGQFSKDKIVTFIGGRSGVGTTTVALNTAVLLADRGLSVLYIEVNDRHPSAAYWYDLSQDSIGIDTALKGLSERRFGEIEGAIVRSTELKKRNTAMKSNYRKFPNSLDFMCYSKEYLVGVKNKEIEIELKELYLYLIYQCGYDYVVVDLSQFASERDIQGAIMYSNKVFTVLTQDVSTIGYHLATLNSLEQEGVSILKKNHYVLNNYTDSSFNKKEIQDWLNVKDITLIPNSGNELTNANAKGLPIAIHAKRSKFTTSIQEIISIIGGK